MKKSPQKHKNFLIDVWQDSEFISAAGKNLRKSSISDIWQGFELVFVAINDFRNNIDLRCLTRFWIRSCNLYFNNH